MSFEQIALIIASTITMLLMVALTCVLMYYTCRLKMAYRPLKILIRTIVLDFWYIRWLGRWLWHNTLAIWSVPTMFCLVFIISQLSGLLFNREILKRTTELIIVTPILWVSLTGLIYFLLRRGYKLI